MKKIMALLSALALMLTAGCSSGSVSTENAEPQNFQVEDLEKTAYLKQSAELPESMTAIYLSMSYSGGERLLLLGSGAQSPMFWTADRDMTSFTELSVPDFDIGVQYNVDTADDGSMAVILVDADYGDLPEPDFEDPDFNRAEYDAAAAYSFVAAKYSPEGELISSVPLTGLPPEPDQYTSIEETVTDGEYILASIGGSVYLIGLDGRYIGEVIPGEGETIGVAGRDSRGRLVCTVTGENGMQVRQVNTADATLLPSTVTYDTSKSGEEIRPGTDGYALFIRTLSMIYGIREEGDGYGEMEPLFSTGYAGIGSTGITGFVRRTDGLFTVMEMDWNAFAPKVRTYTPVSQEEYDRIPRITVGMYSEDYLSSGHIEAFNESHDVQADIKLYNTSKNWDEETYNRINEKLTQDALSGDLPDILAGDNSGRIGDIDMVQKDVFVDLYSYIDKSSSLSREDFVPSLLESMDHGGTLPMLSNRLELDLGYVAKTKYVKDVGKWDMDAFITLLEKMPEMNEKWADVDETADMRFRKWFDPYEWIDLENASCSFDSDSFIRVLRYCSSANGVNPYEDQNFDDPQSPEAQAETARLFIRQQRDIMDDNTLMESQSLYGIDQWLQLKEGRFAGEDMTILGVPTPDGGHTYTGSTWKTYGITKFSQHPDEAFELIEYLVSDEFAAKFPNYIGIPVTWSAIDATYKTIADHDPSYLGGDTEYRYPLGDGTFMELGTITPEIYEEVLELLKKADPKPDEAARFTQEDGDWYGIILEETGRCFNGECTPEECASVLQNRMETFISERYG